MATIKSFSDLQQSKELAKILPLESADCFWDYDDLQKYHRINWFEEGYDKDSQLRLNKNNIYAWSLAALFGVLPNKIVSHETAFEGEDAEGINDIYYKHIESTEDGRYMCLYSGNGYKYRCVADNPVDACVAMIEKLHKLNLL